ncbi:MFS transporter [Parendozoicomonas sp. Alg238-R29]|uniref:MFS transporter n=1 Tax=Parendozoicomonas sp. Alg238-R29 TaxID=2993446 RepID=UPI00248D7340|nr:MFS transporter [Parendozoicomonas sp. Alg238-R29]
MRDTSKLSGQSHTLAMIIAVVLQGAGQTALLACLPLLNEITKAGYSLLTAALSAGMVMVLFTAPFWGARSDRLGRLTVIRIALLAIAVGNIVLALVVLAAEESLLSPLVVVALIFASRIVYGAFVGGLYPSVQAHILDTTPHAQRAKALSRVSAAINVGRLLGPLAGLVAVHWGVAALLVALGVAPLLLLMVMGVKAGKAEESSKEEESPNIREPLWQLCGPVFVMAVFVTGVFGVLQFSIGPVLQTRLQLSSVTTTEQLSSLMMVVSLITLIMHVICSRLMGRRHLTLLRAGATILLTGCLVLVQTESMWAIWIGLSLAAASVMMMTPAYTALAAEQVNHERGKMTGLLSMMHSGGYAISGIVAGAAMTLGIDMVMFGALVLASILFLITTIVVDDSPIKINSDYKNPDYKNPDYKNPVAPGVN